jgi:BSD domain
VGYSTTRLDAQLHMLHTNLELFGADSSEKSFVEWTKEFSADERTDQIAKDLERYPELRSTMEKLVPDSVQYADFWRRYYFLRNELDMEEQKRKELLKGMPSDLAGLRGLLTGNRCYPRRRGGWLGRGRLGCRRQISENQGCGSINGNPHPKGRVVEAKEFHRQNISAGQRGKL